MTDVHDARAERQRRRWMRPNAHLYIRHDAWRVMPPGSPRHVGPDVVKYLWPSSHNSPPQHSAGRNDARALDEALAFERRQLIRLQNELAALKAEIRFRRLLRTIKAYNPNQPRVPAGNPDGGQWTSEGGLGGVSLAAGDRPRLGSAAMVAIALEVAKRAIEAFRKENGLQDLFGSKIGTVTATTINDKQIFGSNSTSPTYTSIDYSDALGLRDSLLEKYPDVMDIDNVGRRPNDAVFHAEANVLLRAARENGGTLAGQQLEVYGDRNLCRSCETVLPYVGLELGDPTVTFVGPNGRKRTMRGGSWIE